MPRRHRSRATFDRNDPFRAILTDTSTDDVPIIFSNDGLRANIARRGDMPTPVGDVITSALFNLGDKYTLPYRYRIAHGEGGFRQLSLAHPASQLSTSEIYQDYADLITYYCSRSTFSIRHPVKVASSFYVKNPLADLNKYRDSSVMMERTEKLFRHPSSYFAYAGHIDRYYKYFQSNEFYSMEKKYQFMLKLDVSKCFSSIYTHTISWAIKDIDHGKLNNRAVSLGNDLDKCMQRMNYNETNGILIGPEFSRIFAEIILQAVDHNIEVELASEGILAGRDYDIRRYIDDYLIFSSEQSRLQRIKLTIAENLANFNMHLNEAKTESFSRPFQTAQSAVVDAAVAALDQFWKQNTTLVEHLEVRYTIANKVGNYARLAKSFLRVIKTVCHENGTDYGSVAPVLVASIDERIQRLVDSYDRNLVPHDHRQDQILMMMSLLEVSYFLYSVKPSVSSSYRIGRSTILAIRFCRQNLGEFMPVLCEHIIQQSNSFFDASIVEAGGAKLVQIERLNLLLSLTELPTEYFSRFSRVLEESAKHARDHFELCSIIFCAGRGKLLGKLAATIEMSVIAMVQAGLRPGFSARDCFLALDLISCPYLPRHLRSRVLVATVEGLSQSPLTQPEREVVLDDFAANPWFIKWDRIDLLREMTKRELNQVY